MKGALALICLVVFTAGCAAAEQKPSAGDKLYEAVARGSAPELAVIDARSQAADRRLALGVPSADWTHVYSILSTSLVDTDPQTGSIRNSMRLGDSFQLPAATANGLPGGLSPDGRWLVVERVDAAPGSMPKATHMLLIDTSRFTVARKIDLAGYFQFDAVSNNGINLYLIQHLNAREYYVRLYDVPSNTLTENIVVDKSDGNQAMAGVRLSGIATPDGRWLFSMYVREHESPFIHALSLDGPFAFCLDLPGAGYGDDPREMNWSLAMAADGSNIFAVNPSTGVVAMASTGANDAPAIIRTAHISPAGAPGVAMHGTNAAAVNGRTLVAGGPGGLVWIDTSTLAVSGRTVEGWRISTVGLSPDGKNVYAVSDSGRIAIVSMSSRAVTAMFDPSAGQPMALMRVAAA